MGYSFQNYNPKNMVRVLGKTLPMSTKASVNVAAHIKGKQVDKVLNYLKAVIETRAAIPYKRYNRDIPHKPGKGFGPGRYPKKVSEHVIELLEKLKSAAATKGLDTSKLTVIHAAAQKGPVVWHYGRRRIKRKNTHFEIVAKEVEPKKKKKIEEAKEMKGEEKKTQAKTKSEK